MDSGSHRVKIRQNGYIIHDEMHFSNMAKSENSYDIVNHYSLSSVKNCLLYSYLYQPLDVIRRKRYKHLSYDVQ